jgi:hypothetical protein
MMLYCSSQQLHYKWWVMANLHSCVETCVVVSIQRCLHVRNNDNLFEIMTVIIGINNLTATPPSLAVLIESEVYQSRVRDQPSTSHISRDMMSSRRITHRNTFCYLNELNGNCLIHLNNNRKFEYRKNT